MTIVDMFVSINIHQDNKQLHTFFLIGRKCGSPFFLQVAFVDAMVRGEAL